MIPHQRVFLLFQSVDNIILITPSSAPINRYGRFLCECQLVYLAGTIKTLIFRFFYFVVACEIFGVVRFVFVFLGRQRRPILFKRATPFDPKVTTPLAPKSKNRRSFFSILPQSGRTKLPEKKVTFWLGM